MVASAGFENLYYSLALIRGISFTVNDKLNKRERENFSTGPKHLNVKIRFYDHFHNGEKILKKKLK